MVSPEERLCDSRTVNYGASRLFLSCVSLTVSFLRPGRTSPLPGLGGILSPPCGTLARSARKRERGRDNFDVLSSPTARWLPRLLRGSCTARDGVTKYVDGHESNDVVG